MIVEVGIVGDPASGLGSGTLPKGVCGVMKRSRNGEKIGEDKAR